MDGAGEHDALPGLAPESIKAEIRDFKFSPDEARKNKPHVIFAYFSGHGSSVREK